MKNLYFIAWLILFLSWSSSQAFLGETKSELQNYRLSNVFLLGSQSDENKSLYMYDRLIEKLEKGSLTISSQDTKTRLDEIIGKLKLRKNSIISDRNTIDRHKTLILKFGAGAQSIDFLESKRAEIETSESVFIFRTGKIDLPGYQIEAITKKLKEINSDIFIFIDQEGGLINRYVEFDIEINFKNYLTDDVFVKDIYSKLSADSQLSINLLFPENYKYFPSLTRIGELYIDISEEDKENYLDLIAYLRLKTLKDRNINTYGLVMDLNRGNPVITNYRRSFGSDLENYKRLGDAFINASKRTGVSLYLKHFPGHGAGQVDSHSGILDYSNYSSYLEDNLELFEYMLNNKDYTQIGLMVGHMYVPNTLESKFSDMVDTSDYLLTDDLAMKGYTLATGGNIENVFFTTDLVFDSEKTILVDSLLNPKIK